MSSSRRGIRVSQSCAAPSRRPGRINRDDAARAFGGGVKNAIGLAARRYAVHGAIGATMQACKRPHAAIAPRHQAIRPTRRPRLEHVELLARSALDWFEEARTAG